MKRVGPGSRAHDAPAAFAPRILPLVDQTVTQHPSPLPGARPRVGEPPPAQGAQDSIDLSRLVSALVRNLWLISLCVVLALAAGYAYAFHVATVTYRSTTTMVLRHDQTDPLTAAPAEVEFAATRINTEIAVLRSDGLLGRVIGRLGLIEDPEFNPYLGDGAEALQGLAPEERSHLTELGTIAELRATTGARNVPGTYILEVTAQATTPAVAQAIAGAIVGAYQANQVEQKAERSRFRLDWLTSRLEELQTELAASQARIEELGFGAPGAGRPPVDPAALERLTAEAEAIRALHQVVLARFAEANIEEGQYRADTYVLNPATQPIEPYRPRPPLIMLVSLVIGGIAGVGLALLRETLSDVVRDPGALERLTGRPVIGVAPRMGRVRRWGGARRRFGLGRPRLAAAMEAVRANLAMMPGREDNPPRSVAVTSTLPQEGKSALVLALAASYATAATRVLIVDADLRRRTVSRWMVPGADTGLRSVLSGTASLKDAVARVADLGLDVLPCEASPRDPFDVLSSPSFSRVLDGARGAYDMVVIDTAPLLAVADARPVCRAAEFVLYVARRNLTSARHLEEALGDLRNVGVQIDAAVMTAVRPSVFDWSRNAAARGYLPRARGRRRTGAEARL